MAGKTFLIVHDKTTKQAAEFLKMAVGERLKQGDPVNAAVMDVKEYRNLQPERRNAGQCVLYIGDFPESRAASGSIMKWRCDKWGFRYGWFGTTGVIQFDNQNVSPADFNAMAKYSEEHFKEMGFDMTNAAKEKTWGDYWEDLPWYLKVVAGTVGAAACIVLLMSGGDGDV